MKILQTNLGRAHGAHDVAVLTATEENVDMIVVSEPNKSKTGTAGWISDPNKDVAIYIRNRNIEIGAINKTRGIIILQMQEFDLYACYMPPSLQHHEYEERIDYVVRTVQARNREALIIGDFNAKAEEWCSPLSDARGQILADAAASLRLTAHNKPGHPTFVRGSSETYIDVTFTTENLTRQMKSWTTLDNEPLSYHKHILFEVGEKVIKNPNTFKGKVHISKTRFREAVTNHCDGKNISNAQQLNAAITKCYKSAKTRQPQNTNSAPYWWTDRIDELRTLCIKARRQYQREIRHRDTTDLLLQELKSDYKNKKKELNNGIRQSKKACWTKLCEELEADIWGQSYKIVMQRFKGGQLPYKMTKAFRNRVIQTLFPTSDVPLIIPDKDQNPPPFTRDEVESAARALKTGKAPGPDGIPAEAVKEIVAIRPDLVQNVLNQIISAQNIPPEFKTAKLVFIHKTGKPADLENSYRPLCLINSMAKLLETILRDRLAKEVQEGEDLAPNQYGFRKGRSTLDAIRKVEEIAKNVRFDGAGDRWCVLVTVDVKNAFNSASWNEILNRLQTRKISKYLIATIRDYFYERTINDAGTVFTQTAGIPQGSVMGPLLWNIMYDPILTIDYPEGVEVIGFADDLAAVVVARTRDEVRTRVDGTLKKISNWMETNKLSLVPEKTGIVVLNGPRARRHFKFKLNGADVTPTKHVKYLGVRISENFYLSQHVQDAVQKTGERLRSLSALMPNIKGPSFHKRRLFYGVLKSTLMYAAPIWGRMVKMDKYRKMVESVQRRALIRITSAYRTISTVASQVIAGIAPIVLEILAQEAAEREQLDAKAWIEQKWQERWENEGNTAQWTRRLIPNISTWTKCKHRRTDYFLTQALTGHGCFKAYTEKIGKTDGNCLYCERLDTAEHTIFECNRWTDYRRQAEIEVDRSITADNMVELMTLSKENWEHIHGMVTKILTQKEIDERREQAR